MLDQERRPGTLTTGDGITLLGHFDLVRDGDPVALRQEAQRVLAYLALHRRPHGARAFCSQLWNEIPEALAYIAMREALDEIGRTTSGVVVESDAGLTLGEHVTVDLSEALASIRDLEDVRRYRRELVEPLSCDVLPDWSDGWVSVERERFHHLRINALEELCRRLTDAGQHADAIEVGTAAVAADPRRERARRALIEAHLAAGNISEAVAVYDSFVEVQANAGSTPTSQLIGLFPPSPAWPVLRVRRSIMPMGATLPGLRSETGARRRLSAGSGYSGRG